MTPQHTRPFCHASHPAWLTLLVSLCAQYGVQELDLDGPARNVVAASCSWWVVRVGGKGGHAGVVRDAQTLVSAELGVSRNHRPQLVGSSSVGESAHQKDHAGVVRDAQILVCVELGVRCSRGLQLVGNSNLSGGVHKGSYRCGGS